MSTGPVSNTAGPVKMPSTNAQAAYWILTIPCSTGWVPPTNCPDDFSYMRGQKEIGSGGYEHWQVVVYFKKKKRLLGAKSFFPNSTHLEATRSDAARAYVWKEDTRVEGTQFELGRLPVRRSEEADWAEIKQAAKAGRLDDVPDDIFVRHYGSLTRIASHYAKPQHRPGVEVYVFWGPTNVGKTYRAWQRAGDDAFDKDPTTFWWDGYQGETAVVIDEYRGGFDLSLLLKWLDGRKCLVQRKGDWVPLKATKFYITSNMDPQYWYRGLDQDSLDAFLRRMNISHVTSREE